ncbi:hypothetical protein HOLleu_10871 [Holothuria leucospilota]|uniref:Uncharacterized protein n=1 Tax=Holothuria leucospilota TaxID=206669 RepID=A0A9Q1CEW2_HOLLE|nr:hypothetical protein HOLleu_10871 [Holothuria leucospilota]
MYEASMHDDKVDYATDTLTLSASEFIRNESLERRVDIFQHCIATVVVASVNNLQIGDIKETYKSKPGHLVDVSDSPPPSSGKLRVGSTTLSHGDLGCLRQGRWINDQIIHAYLNLLMLEHQGKVFILPSA